MAKKDRDWKAKAKALRERVKKLRGRLRDKTEKGGTEKAAKAPNPVSPLAPKGGFPALPVIAGVEFAAVEAAVRYANRKDVMLVRLAPGTAVAGAFTRSSTRAACVLDCQAKLKGKGNDASGAAILVNSGNANAFTGAAGQASVDQVTGAVADALGVPATRVFSSSTGVIGEPLPHDRIVAKIADLTAALDPGGIEMAARAIMTTDTFPKGAMAEIEGDGGTIRIAGIAKGSGMIAPDMATMLVYIFTDAKIAAPALQKMLSRNVDETFNAITVDSDTSTSDALILAATGQSKALVSRQVGFAVDDMLAEARQAIAGALPRFSRQTAACIQSGGHAHRLADAVDHAKLAARMPRHHHVEAVGTDVDGGQQLAVLQLAVRSAHVNPRVSAGGHPARNR